MKMTTTATTTLKVTYEGKDITEDVNVMKCFHTMYAADHADMLEVSFEDNNEWDAWECKRAKRIESIQKNENVFVKQPCIAAGLWN